MKDVLAVACVILLMPQCFCSATIGSEPQNCNVVPVPTPLKTDLTVVAAYMPFWGIERNQPWGDIDRHASFYPLLGAYSSDDSYIYDWHVYWAESVGIDAFIFDMGWFAPDSSIADAIDKVLNHSSYGGQMKFTFNYFTSLAWWEQNKNPGTNVTQYVMNDFEILAERFLWRDNLLRVNGIPMIYVVSDWDYYDPVLAQIVKGIRQVFMSSLSTEVAILIDYVWPGGSTQISDNGVFDGLYKLGELSFVWEHYGWGDMHINYSEMLHYNNLTWYEYSTANLPGDLCYVPCIMPGFNNTRIYESGENSNLLLVDRDASQFEAGIRQLVEYVDPSLDMLYLHTWNDLQEGTSLEPTVEYGLDFVDAVYTGLSGASNAPVLYTPKTYAEEWIELAENAIDENQTVVDTSILQLAQATLSQAQANFTSENYKDATALAIEAYQLMSTPAASVSLPIEGLLIISVVGVACALVVVVKLRK